MTVVPFPPPQEGLGRPSPGRRSLQQRTELHKRCACVNHLCYEVMMHHMSLDYYRVFANEGRGYYSLLKLVHLIIFTTLIVLVRQIMVKAN